jgi:hypothetical protein
MNAFIDHRTKRVILKIYDALAKPIRTGQPYQTRLDPPPADAMYCLPTRTKNHATILCQSKHRHG